MSGDRAAGADGIGLKNVRERMAVQFEGRAALMAGAHGSEWISEISMPAIRESPPLARETPAGSKLHTSTLLGT
jgi:signal transduction histidine kinase